MLLKYIEKIWQRDMTLIWLRFMSKYSQEALIIPLNMSSSEILLGEMGKNYKKMTY